MTSSPTPAVLPDARALKYWNALHECAASSLENGDSDGAGAITLMAERPRVEHMSYARSRRGYPRAACINAIEYALQEFAA